MAKRDSFLLRVDPLVLDALRRWSDDEMRSINAQIEFLLSRALKDAGRFPTKSNQNPTPSDRNAANTNNES